MEFITVTLILMALCMKRLEAAAAIGLSGTSSKYPGMCIDEDTSKPYSLSSSWQMKDTCGQKTCVERSGNLYISYETCGYAQIAPSCYTLADISLDYPACCPRIVCDDDNNVDTVKNVDNDVTNEIDSDEFGFYDVSSYDDFLMMPSDESGSYVSYAEAPAPDFAEVPAPSFAEVPAPNFAEVPAPNFAEARATSYAEAPYFEARPSSSFKSTEYFPQWKNSPVSFTN